MSNADLNSSWPLTLTSAPLLEPLTHWGVIAAEGADARTFLHGQLSQDISGLDPSHWRLAAWCNAKGRMLASLWVLAPEPDTVLMLCPLSVLPLTLQKLSMYVLRAKCKLRDASAEWQLHGHWSATGSPSHLSSDPPGSRTITQDEAGRFWLEAGGAISPLVAARLPLNLEETGVATDANPATAPLRRHLVLTPAGVAAPELSGAVAPSAPLWLLSDIALGWPSIEAATREHFVPQMINWELLDGVNFRKGCYPGQEVVARSQYRGTTKRRALPFGAVLTPDQATALRDAWAGHEVMLATAEGPQAVGEIIQASPAQPALAGQPWTHVGLMEVQLSALDAIAEAQNPCGLFLSPDKMPLTLLQPAYSLARQM